MHPLANALLVQTGWLVTILSAARSAGWIGVVVVAGLAALHARFSAARRGALLTLLVATPLLGYAADAGLTLGGLLKFSSHPLSPLPPLWMAALWLNFATSLDGCLRAVRQAGMTPVSVLLGAIAGPLAYFGAARLGACRLGEPLWLALGAVALQWAIALPLCAWLARLLLDRPAREPAAPHSSLDLEPRS